MGDEKKLEAKVKELEAKLRSLQEEFESGTEAFEAERRRRYQTSEDIRKTTFKLLAEKYPAPKKVEGKLDDMEDAEELKGIQRYLGKRASPKVEIWLEPMYEGIVEIRGYEFDIEMPTSPWVIGKLVKKGDRYHFTKDDVWDPKEHFGTSVEDHIVIVDGEYEFQEKEHGWIEEFYRERK